jgi:hypothetical protein
MLLDVSNTDMSEGQAMKVRGLILPSQFISSIQCGSLRRERGSWQLRDGRDAYANPWEAELGEIYETAERIQRESALLPRHFAPDVANTPEGFASKLGFIPYIIDFGRILAFGIAGDGAEPSIIWWDDAYWRRVAPSFATLSHFLISN